MLRALPSGLGVHGGGVSRGTSAVPHQAGEQTGLYEAGLLGVPRKTASRAIVAATCLYSCTLTLTCSAARRLRIDGGMSY